MEKNETLKKQINEADYIDLTVYIRTFLRLARQYLLLVCPMIVCLTAGMKLLSSAMVKEQYAAETSLVVGVTISDNLSYNYTLPDIRDDYIAQLSAAFQSVLNSEYMQYLLEEELGRIIPGEINWNSVYGTNMGGIYVVSDSMEDAIQLRDAVINCLPKALFTTLGDIELKVLETSERTEVIHEEMNSPIFWGGAGVIGGIFAYLGIIFLITLWQHNIETSEDMAQITDLPCLGSLPKLRKLSSKKQPNHALSRNSTDEYSGAFSEFRKQLEDVIEQHQIKTLLFTGGYKKREQTELLDKLIHDWNDQGKKIQRINMALSKVPKTTVQIQEELNQQIEEALKESDLLIINGPDYEQTIELLSASDCVDGIVYIVKAGYEQMDYTEEAICTIGFAQAKFLGYVITV